MATIDLQKKSVKIVLEKKKLATVTARVGLVLDITGSMRNLYKNGTVQKVVERILAIASQFDDDGMLDVWVYDNEFSRLKPVTERDFDDYVNRIILEDELVHKFGRNDEPPVMKDVLRKYLEEEPSTDPAYIVFINDGGCKKSIKPIIESSAKYPIFWQFVGIGNGNFEFLRKLDTMEGRIVDNANFLQIEEIDKISDDQLYDSLLNEFPSWISEAKQKGILEVEEKVQQSSTKSEPKKQSFWGKLFGANKK
ncbi:vWA domain-containing protein [Neobacillus soli]|uniref:vWA domain-containing protein n=1 Tax=Neobacillus soli TaxID=220688 RepID=UPI0008246AB1|nr:VWA domain-containing protein [Neobacillus soli]